MDESQGGEKVLEFNSNVEVLIRAAQVIRAFNAARYAIMQKGADGQPLAKIEELVSHIITLFKEVSVEMTDNEKLIWNDIKILRNRIENNPPTPASPMYWRTVIHEIDELDIRLRAIAKKHGFLSANKRDASKAALRR